MMLGGQRHFPANSPPSPRKIHSTPFIGGWLGPTAGLDGV